MTLSERRAICYQSSIGKNSRDITRRFSAHRPLRLDAKTREVLAAQRQREGKALADLKAERATLGGKSRRIEMRHPLVAELLGADPDGERAIRWPILTVVLCCQPFA